MNNLIKLILFFLTLMKFSTTADAQGMKMGEVLIISTSTLKTDAKPDEFQNYINKEISPAWNKNNSVTSIHLFLADRGEKKGASLLVCEADKMSERNSLPQGSPFTDKIFVAPNTRSKSLSDFLTDPNSFVEYHLIGADNFKSTPAVSLLGIHFIKVKPERAEDFEKFVAGKLNPAVGQLLPDLRLMYYKAVASDNKKNIGGYITIFAIESSATREKYWPTGAPETETLKKAFQPLKDLAAELGSYLVKGSYLEPESGGAAAYFESLSWTDFVERDF